ncbi:polyketide synthase [Apiospora sp. TS-2023a]
MHALLELGNLSAGKSVLIHTAASGGLGIAAIQLAQYVGADVFITVGTPDEREFVKTTFGICDERIIISRSTELGDQVSAATGGRGVDVALHSLVKYRLEETFLTLADGGIMVVLGERDALEHKQPPMAPFQRNCSIRVVDLSLTKASEAIITRLFATLFGLLHGGAIKPVIPVHRFSWNDIPAALRFLRTGTHLGKVVIAEDDDAGSSIEVPVNTFLGEPHFERLG